MKLLNLLNLFVKRSEFNKLLHNYQALQVEHENLMEVTFDYYVQLGLHENTDKERTPEDALDERIESMCKPCPCGGTIMPMYYENPQLGSFCNRCG